MVIWCGASSVTTQAKTNTVFFKDFSFTPQEITIQVGDTVVWTNEGGSHTVTGDGADPFCGTAFVPAKCSRIFTTAGTFTYHCIPHESFGMVGTVIVSPASNVSPGVTIVSPTNNTTLAVPGSIKIEATAIATGGIITNVEFLDGMTSLGTDTTSPFDINASLSVGTHSLTAKATDSNGATSTSTAVTVIVNNEIPDPIPPKIAKGDITIELQTILDGLVSPLGMAAPDDGSGRLFVYDQVGLIHILINDAKLESPLLDVRNRLVNVDAMYDERGLLGVATHPNFAQKPLIYTYTSEPNGSLADFKILMVDGKTNDHTSVIAEWRIDPANPNRVEPASRREILRIDKPQSNHNGGAMRFGPDGFLYFTVGDGGAADDQGDGHSSGGNGQDKSNILGKVIRIDVDARTSPNGQYGIPLDNPFVAEAGVVQEIYAYGLRNPYSFSFDRQTGELLLGDVGQNQVEEVDHIVKGGNYGWPVKEGRFLFDANDTNDGFVTTRPVRDVPPNLIDPIAQYDHDEGDAIIGGYVYRGSAVSSLSGKYVTGDWGEFEATEGRLFFLNGSELKELRIGANDRPLGLWLKGFGQDSAGELYICGSTNLGPSGTSGKVLKIVPAASLRIDNIAADGNSLNLSWVGGTGPFVVQGKASLTDANWFNVLTTIERKAVVTKEVNQSFFRVADLANTLKIPLTVSLSGAAERPNAVSTTATGFGSLILEGNTLTYNITYSGLSGPATAAHIHGPANTATDTGVLFPLDPVGAFGASGTLAGSKVLDAAQKAALLGGKTYANVHTASNPGGEIRGQVVVAQLQVSLSGEAERPNPVATTAAGHGTLSLIGDQLTYHINYSGLSAAATAAHIHGPADTTKAAGVLFPLAPVGGFGTSGELAGTVKLTADQMAYVADGLVYANIHTSNNPGGEIRGQVSAQITSIPFTVAMSGAAERPTPVTTPASGFGHFSLEGDTLLYRVFYSGLSRPATAAHIHGPADTATATGVLFPLDALGAFGVSGTLAGSKVLDAAQKAALLSGKTYANVHDVNNPGGEIRGQVVAAQLQASLNGAAEQPNPVTTTGTGTGSLSLIGDQLTYHINYSGLSAAATAAHIHGPADTTKAAGVLFPLDAVGALGTSGELAGTVKLTAEQSAYFADRLVYANIHTKNNPGGEIRGQVGP